MFVPSATSAASSPTLEQIADHLAEVVERSPADDTEAVWIDTRGGEASADADGVRGRDPGPPRGTVLVRVRERGRVGFHRTGAASATGLDATVRHALGQARLRGEGPPLPLPPAGAAEAEVNDLHDPAVAALDATTACDLLAAGRGGDDSRGDEDLHLTWRELRFALANSRGLNRAAAATCLTLQARCGEGPGAGYGAASARSLAALAAPRVLERARASAAAEDDGVESAVPGRAVLLLSAEAVAALVRLFAACALTSRSFLDETSFLAGRVGETVLAPQLTLVDDGTDAAGLPFPCDFDGWPKRAVPLVEAGVLASPALDPELARRLGRTPTPHAVDFDEARPDHLFVAPGEATMSDLYAAADGGLWIARLEEVRCTDPWRGRFRAVARGVRRATAGGLGAALPDLHWEGELGTALGRVAAVGDQPVVLATGDGWGGVSAPALVLPEAGELRSLDG
jgi:predicted Zn-dependent protease